MAGKEAKMGDERRAHTKVNQNYREHAARCSDKGKKTCQESATREPPALLLLTIYCLKLPRHLVTIKPVVTIGASMSDITIGRLSDATGVKVETIRYYEKIGIMPNPPRTSGGQRIYAATHQARLKFVKRSRDLGFSLESVRTLLGLSDEPPSCGEVLAITMTHLQDVRHKIDDLERLEKTLSAIASECAGGETPNCPIIDTLAA